MTSPTSLPAADTTAATPAFRRLFAAASALMAFWIVLQAFPASVFSDIAAAGVALAAGLLAFRNATLLLMVFVALLPVGLFAAGIAGL